MLLIQIPGQFCTFSTVVRNLLDSGKVYVIAALIL